MNLEKRMACEAWKATAAPRLEELEATIAKLDRVLSPEPCAASSRVGLKSDEKVRRESHFVYIYTE